MPLPRPNTLENANVGNAVIHVSTNDINKGDSFKSMQLLKKFDKIAAKYFAYWTENVFTYSVVIKDLIDIL